VAVTQGAHLIDDLPNLAGQLQDRLASWGVNVDLVSLVRDRDRLDTMAENLRSNAVQLSSQAVGAVVKGVGAMFVAFWVCVDGPKLRHLIAKRVPLENRHHVETVWDTAVERTGGYLLSRVILGAVGAGFFSCAFVAIGIPYAVPFGIWAGFVAMVPLVGSWMGILLPVALTLGQNPTKAALALGAFWVLQYVKNLFVVPRVTRKTVNVHPLVSFSAVVIGAALAGGLGALLALPLTASAIGIVSAIEADRRASEPGCDEPGSDAAKVA
jgi:predicted PurR-regulated permease PerM